MYTHKRARTHTHTCTHTHTHTHTHALYFRYRKTLRRWCWATQYAKKKSRIHSQIRKHKTHTLPHTHAHTHLHHIFNSGKLWDVGAEPLCIRKRSHAYMHKSIHTNTHTHSHILTHIYAHTHLHHIFNVGKLWDIGAEPLSMRKRSQLSEKRQTTAVVLAHEVWAFFFFWKSNLQPAPDNCHHACVQSTGWRKSIGCLICTAHFPQKSTTNGGSFAERDLQLQASCGSLPPRMSCFKSSKVSSLPKFTNFTISRFTSFTIPKFTNFTIPKFTTTMAWSYLRLCAAWACEHSQK